MNFNNFTIKAQEAVQEAVNLTQANNGQAIEPVHLLQAVMKVGENITKFIFQKLGINGQQIANVVARQIESQPKVSGGSPYLSRESNDVLQKAVQFSKELGDVLLHVAFYAKIGEEKQHYDIVDVINFLCDKLIYRHPHVFSTAEVGSAEDVVKQWEMLKTKEKDGNKTVLSGVPDGLPPLLKAYRMQDKARGVGFDWEKKEDVWEKVKEEMGE